MGTHPVDDRRKIWTTNAPSRGGIWTPRTHERVPFLFNDGESIAHAIQYRHGKSLLLRLTGRPCSRSRAKWSARSKAHPCRLSSGPCRHRRRTYGRHDGGRSTHSANRPLPGQIGSPISGGSLAVDRARRSPMSATGSLIFCPRSPVSHAGRATPLPAIGFLTCRWPVSARLWCRCCDTACRSRLGLLASVRSRSPSHGKRRRCGSRLPSLLRYCSRRR
jgi:hypothetical protein